MIAEPGVPGLRPSSAPLKGRPRVGNLIALAIGIVVIGILRWVTIKDPPAWDSAMGMFPAAIYLADSGFDVSSLLQLPGFSFGGPNSHSLSPVTWLTSAVLVLEPSSPLPILHILHFIMGAVGLLGVYRLARLLLPSMDAVLVSVAVLAFPSVMAQLGYIYLEIPLMAAAVWCVYHVATNRRWAALLLACLAVAIKPTGIFVVPTLALLETAATNQLRRVFRTAATVAAPLALGFALLLLSPAGRPFHPTIGALIADDWRYLSAQWDLVLIWIGFVALLVARRGRTDADSGSTYRARAKNAVALAPLSFLGLFLIFPLLGLMIHALTRYYVVVLPFLLTSVGSNIHQVWRRGVSVLLVSMIALSIVNREGDLYTDNDVFDFPIIERSDAYRRLIAIQTSSLSFVEASVEGDVPLIVGLPQHYMTQWPMMGYVAFPRSNVRSVWLDSTLAGGNLACYPEKFVMIIDYWALGGETLSSIWKSAMSELDTKVDVTEIRSGQFVGYVVRVDRRSSLQLDAGIC